MGGIIAADFPFFIPPKNKKAMITELEREAFSEREATQKAASSPKEKATQDLGELIAPVFQEVPPAPKAGLYLEEGLRSWAFIAISAIADEIASIELSTFKRSGEDWVEHTNNQILNTMNYPNQVQTKEDLMWLTVVYLLAEGEAPLLLNNSKNPTQMVLINPNKLKIKYDRESIVSGYTYQQSNGQMKDIDKDLILFLKIPSVHTPLRGTGMMKYIAQTLDIDNYIEEYLRMFFFNDATPGSVLETDKELSKVAYDRLTVLLKTKHQGIKKKHKNLILEGGLKWKDVGSKLNELGLKELNDSQRDKILAAFKVPKSILGITEDVNRANGENSDRVFAKRCIRPKLKLIQAQLNQFFIPKFSDGANYWVEFDNPVKEDELIQAQVDNIYVTAGIWSKNEVRARMEMPPLEELVKTDPTATDPNAKPEPVTPPAVDPNSPDGSKDDELKGYTGRKHWNPILIRKFKDRFTIEVKAVKDVKKKKKGSAFVEVMTDFLKMKSNAKTAIVKDYSKEELADFHTKKISFTEKIEADYVRVIQAYFKQVEEQLLGSFKGYKKKTVKYNLDDEEEAELMAELSIPFIEDTVVKESALAYAFVGIPDQRLDSQDKIVQRFIKSRTLKLGKSTAETTRNDVQGIIDKWNEQEGDIALLKQMLGEYFGDESRADMIARTEVSRAAGFAQETVYEEVGAVGKKWITADDERTCEFCSEMDGQTTGVTDSYWEKGDEVAGAAGGILSVGFDDISSPPLHPSCRCDLIPIFNDEKSMKAFKKQNLKKLEVSKKLSENEKVSKELDEKKSELDAKMALITKKEAEINDLKALLEKQGKDNEKATKKEIKKYESLREDLEKKIKEVEEIKDSI